MKKVLSFIPVLLLLGLLFYKFVYQAPKFSDGEDIPNFEAQLLNGEQFELSDLKGSYVLLDFWGSWCGPCRVDNPNIVKLHQEFNDKKFSDAKGFEVVSVAIETNEKMCKRAILQDNLYWDHHIVLLDRFKSDIAKEFGVREIPTKYLLAPNGNILSVNEPYDKMRERLQSKLN